MFQNMNDQVLEVICNHHKPVIYNESSYIIREGDPLDRMPFIIQGTARGPTKTVVLLIIMCIVLTVMNKVLMVIP